VRIRDELWIGHVGDFKLTKAMERALMDRGVLNLCDIVHPRDRGTWIQKWKLALDLNLLMELVEDWNRYL
jgi:hypothetical protein